MFCFKWPDVASHLCIQLDCCATTGACIGETKQAVYEFIMQRQSLRARFFSRGPYYLLITSQALQIKPLPVHAKMGLLDVGLVYIFTLYTDLHFYSC